MAEYQSGVQAGLQTFQTLFGAYAQGRQLNQQKEYQDATIDIHKRQLAAKEKEIELELAPIKEFMGLTAADNANYKDRNVGLESLQQLNAMARLPKSMRDVDTLAAAFQQQTGITLAPNVIKTLKTASSEELGPVLREATRQIVENPEMGMSHLKPVLESPLAFQSMLTRLNDAATATAKTEAVTGPTQDAPKDPHAAEKEQVAKLEKQRDRFLSIAERYPSTKAGQAYAVRADHLQQRIDKLSGRYDVKPTNQMTQTHLSVRIGGKKTGNPFIDAMSPAEARDALDRLQKGELVPQVDENGVITGLYVPKSGLAGMPIPDKHLNERTAKLGKSLADSRAASIFPALKILDKAVDAFDSGQDMPGIGYVKNMPIATFMKTPAGKHIAAARQLLQNEEMKQISGGAVTDPEAIRNEIARAMTKAHSAEDWIRVYKDMIRPMYNAIFRNILAEAGPDAVEVYRRRAKGFDPSILVNEKYDAVWSGKDAPQAGSPQKQGGDASLPKGFVEVP